MYYTKGKINIDSETECITKSKVCEESQTLISGVHSLTTYKKVVDIKPKVKYYGLKINDFENVQLKHKKQKTFLNSTFIYDKISSNYIPLSNITISANHNSNRYYSEIQNRINTLVHSAETKNLTPVFMTITLPSEYHKMKVCKKTKKLIKNPLYNNTSPRESVKELTRMFSKLRHDRSLKELTKDERIYYRVNEPHKDGTPHTHILLYIPKEKVERVVKAFNRLFFQKSNKIETNIRNASAYIMKYINKTLPLAKKEMLSEKEKYLNAWYSKHRIIRFNSSRTLAPLKLYRLLHRKFTLKELTHRVKSKSLDIFVLATNLQKIMEVFDGDELIYRRSDNYKLKSGLD